MAKKKGSKSSVNIFSVLFIISLVTILFLLGQLELKEKELKKYKKTENQERLPEKTLQDNNKKELAAALNGEQELLARKQIKENIETMVERKPKMADKWFLSDIKFRENNIVTIYYEDGHEAGDISLKIIDPANYKTWKKLEK